MNIHHLELFYYVARHGGISEAVRNIPYGIQQPAVSAQVIALEEDLGLTLFHRRPFALTSAGTKLYEFIRPFFDNLDRIAAELQGGVGQHIAVGASEIVLREHLPNLIDAIRARFPKLKLTLQEGYHPELMSWIEKRELDIAITLVENKPPAGLNVLPLASFSVVLLTHRKSGINSAQELWDRDRIDLPLIGLPAAEPISKQFQQALAKLKIDWFPSITVSSLELIETYVSHDYGIGIGIDVPGRTRDKAVRVLPLPGFPSVTIGAYWQGKLTPLMKAFIDAAQARAHSISISNTTAQNP